MQKNSPKNLAFSIELQSNHSSSLTPESLSKGLKHRLEKKFKYEDNEIEKKCLWKSFIRK